MARTADAGGGDVRRRLAAEGARLRHPQPRPVHRRPDLPPRRRRQGRRSASTPPTSVVPRTIHDQVNTDRSASRTTLGMGGSDTLPGFFGGSTRWCRSASPTVSRSSSRRPRASTGRCCPPPPGTDGLRPGREPADPVRSPRTARTRRRRWPFIDFLLRPPNMVRLALGDWMLPTGTEALKDPALRTPEYDWATGTALAGSLRSGPGAVRPRLSGVEGQGRHAWPPGVLQRRDRPGRRCGSGWSRTAIWCWPGTSADGATRTHHVPAGSGNSRLAKAPGGSRRPRCVRVVRQRSPTPPDSGRHG